MKKTLTFCWEHLRFHLKNPVLIVAVVFFIGSFFGWYFNWIPLVESLNIALIAALVGVTSLYARATNKLVKINSALIAESRKTRVREHLEKKLEIIYVPLYENFVRKEKICFKGDNRNGLYLSDYLGSIFLNGIKYHLYLADEELRDPLRKILDSDEKHKVDKTTFYDALKLITDGLHKYTRELEEITKWKISN